ncbi:MAG TPA: hypothetical protein VKB88_47065 [Bryobacteraceae bacterium]|nr:hypothetical protein [Bryobacteraceae bacterium]
MGRCDPRIEAEDALAWRSRQRTARAAKAGYLAAEMVSVGAANTDGHRRPETTPERLAPLKLIVKANGTVTAGNAPGVNDGACAILVGSEAAVTADGLTPRARFVASAAVVAPRVMGLGPVPASPKALERAGVRIDQMDVRELNEAFAAQAIAVLRPPGIAEDRGHGNPNGGAIAPGHRLGASGARLVTTAVPQFERGGGRYALPTMCSGVGQGTARVMERV